MSLGGIILLVLVVTTIIIGIRVRSNSKKLEELDEIIGRIKG
jgi:hypothetical protein